MSLDKIKTYGGLVRVAIQQRRAGKALVTINGCFDVLHVGHVRAIKEAKQQGDVLFVGLNSDDYIRTHKGREPQESRDEIIAELRDVDYVCIIPGTEIAEPLIRAVLPDVHVPGSEYSEDNPCPEAEAIQLLQTHGLDVRIHYAQFHEGYSTTNIVERLRS